VQSPKNLPCAKAQNGIDQGISLKMWERRGREDNIDDGTDWRPAGRRHMHHAQIGSQFRRFQTNWSKKDKREAKRCGERLEFTETSHDQRIVDVWMEVLEDVDRRLTIVLDCLKQLPHITNFTVRL
jgi:hypothetical protein